MALLMLADDRFIMLDVRDFRGLYASFNSTIHAYTFAFLKFFFINFLCLDVDWTFTTPLLLVDLCGFAGVGFELTFLLVAADVLMIVAGAVGAFIEGTEKYAFFAFSMLAFIPIIYFLAFTLKGKAHVTGANAASVYGTTSTLTILTWSAYPIVWVFAEGTRTISPDLECVIYAVLDLIAKSIFGFVVISARDAIGESIRVLSSAEKATGYGAISDA